MGLCTYISSQTRAHRNTHRNTHTHTHTHTTAPRYTPDETAPLIVLSNLHPAYIHLHLLVLQRTLELLHILDFPHRQHIVFLHTVGSFRPNRETRQKKEKKKENKQTNKTTTITRVSHPHKQDQRGRQRNERERGNITTYSPASVHVLQRSAPLRPSANLQIASKSAQRKHEQKEATLQLDLGEHRRRKN
jgi:hypothetical protein